MSRKNAKVSLIASIIAIIGIIIIAVIITHKNQELNPSGTIDKNQELSFTTYNYTSPSGVTWVAINEIPIPLELVGSIAVSADTLEHYGIATSGDVVIPEAIFFNEEYFIVSNIDTGTFQDNTNITSVTIPNSVVSIYDNAFSGCTNLKNVTIPDSVNYVGRFVFYKTAIENITIPSNVKEIGIYALGECPNLKEINITENTVVSGTLFTNAELHELYKRNDGYYVFNGTAYNIDREIVTGDIVIPSDITNLGACLFQWHEGITSIKVPQSVNLIEFSAIRDLVNLKSLEIQGSAKINIGLASGCSSLTDVTLSDTLDFDGMSHFEDTPYKELSIVNNIFYAGPYLMDGRQASGNVIIPDDISVIIQESLSENQNITSVVFGENVRIIEEGAFYNCDNLSNVTFNDKLESIDIGAFNSCGKLNNIKLPDSLQILGAYTFYDCENLESIKLSNDLKILEESSFGNCFKLKSVELGSGLEVIRDLVFAQCSSLKELDLTQAKALKSIGSSIIVNSGIKDLFVPETVIELQENSFTFIDHITYHGPVKLEELEEGTIRASFFGALSMN